MCSILSKVKEFCTLYAYSWQMMLLNRNADVFPGVTYDQEEVYALGSNQEEIIPQVGSWVAMDVSTILNPGRFYVLLPMGNKSLDDLTSCSGRSRSKSRSSVWCSNDQSIISNSSWKIWGMHTLITMHTQKYMTFYHVLCHLIYFYINLWMNFH